MLASLALAVTLSAAPLADVWPYAVKHGAEVRTFMPTLISFRDRQGELRGVAGIRSAAEGALYLERLADTIGKCAQET